MVHLDSLWPQSEFVFWKLLSQSSRENVFGRVDWKVRVLEMLYDGSICFTRKHDGILREIAAPPLRDCRALNKKKIVNKSKANKGSQGNKPCHQLLRRSA
jgi:hypothetical protein